MPPGAGSDAFFSFGSDFPQIASEIIDIARGLRGELESSLAGGAIGESMFNELIAASTRAATDSVNNVKAAKQQIIEALSSGSALPAGGLLGGIDSAAIGRELSAGILDPLRRLPATLVSEVLPQIEGALAR